MLKREREREILQLLREREGTASVHELCELLYASESSVRRDLRALEDAGEIRRTHGGAELLLHSANVVDFRRRSHENEAAKKEIAQKAATLIGDGDVILLDQSSTSFYLACEVMGNASLTVITNNIEILGLLAGSGTRVLCSGGYLSHDNRNCLQGTDAQATFEQLHADIAFFSTKAISEQGEIFDCTREEILVRQAMLAHAERRVFLCDSTKFGKRAPYRQCHLNDVDVLVSEGDGARHFCDIAPGVALL